MTYRLSDAVRDEGYTFIVDSGPGCRSDILGNPDWSCSAAVCNSMIIACHADYWDFAYSCAHEIAEHRSGFQHSEAMWSEQAVIMHRWLKKLSQEQDKPERHHLLKWVMCLAYAIFLFAIALILGGK